MGNEMIPDVLDKPPKYPLDLTYKTIRTFPGMKVTADVTKFKPMLHWPAEPDALYTVILSNLDINNRKNRSDFLVQVSHMQKNIKIDITMVNKSMEREAFVFIGAFFIFSLSIKMLSNLWLFCLNKPLALSTQTDTEMSNLS